MRRAQKRENVQKPKVGAIIKDNIFPYTAHLPLIKCLDKHPFPTVYAHVGFQKVLLPVRETGNTDFCQYERSVEPPSEHTGSFMKSKQLKDLETSFISYM